MGTPASITFAAGAGLVVGGGINAAAVQAHYYLDSVNGSDANSGRSASQARATPAGIMALGSMSGKTIGVARGSTFTQELALNGDGISIIATGTGPDPLWECRDVLASWVKTGGRTNVYESAITLPGNSKILGNAWADTAMLTQVTSLALCDSTPGSCYVASWSSASTTLYLHPPGSTNPAVDGRVYQYSARGSGISLTGVRNRISGQRGLGNAHQDGSFRSGEQSTVIGITADDGCRHNALVGANSWVYDSSFTRGRNDLEAPPAGNGLVANSPDVAGKTFATVRCSFYQGAGGTAFAGAIQHGTGADLFGNVLHIEDRHYGLLSDCYTAKALITTITNVQFSACGNVVLLGTGGVCSITGCTGTVNRMTNGSDVGVACLNNTLTVPLLDGGSPGFYRCESAAATPLAITGDTITVTAGPGSNGRIIHHKWGAVNVTGSRFGPALCAPLHQFAVMGFSGGTATYAGANNLFPYGSSWVLNGTTYNTLAEWQAAGYDQTSAYQPFPATVYSDDFNRADGVLDGSGAWIKSGAGAAATVSNQLRISTSGVGIYRFPDLASQDQWVRFTVASVPASAGPFVVLRASDQLNWIGIRWNNGAYQLYKSVAGAIAMTSGGQPSGVTATAGDVVVVGLRGDRAWVYVNARLVLAFPTIAATAVTGLGVGIYCSPTLNPFIDNISCGIL